MSDKLAYDLRGAKFGGGFATEGGTQIGGVLNDFSQNIDQSFNEITNLIHSLRTMAKAFPDKENREALEHLNDLEEDIQIHGKRKPSRIKATIAALLGMSMAIGSVVATATDFTNNVFELSEKLGIPIEAVQPR